MCRKYSKAIQELSFVSLMRITTSIPLKIKLKENMVCLQIGDVLAWLKADVKQDVQPSMIGWKILKESIIMPLHFVKTQWCFLVLIFSFIKDLFLHTFRLAVCDYFLLWICLVKKDFFSFLQFSMCRNYSLAIQELKSVSLMKITMSIPLGIKLMDYKVSLQIGDVLVRDIANVRRDVQLLMIGWKALKESIIMPLHFVKAQWYFLVRIFSFNKARF